jgi:hypothetical protein
VYEDVLEPHTGHAFFVKASKVIRMEQRPSLHNGRNQIADVLFVTPDLEQISDHLNNNALEGLHPCLYGVYDTVGADILGQFIIDPDGVIQAMEVLTPPMGRNVCELISQVQAFRSSGRPRAPKPHRRAGSPAEPPPRSDRTWWARCGRPGLPTRPSKTS